MGDDPKERAARDSQIPPDARAGERRESSPPSEGEERESRWHRGRLEGVIPELLKRAVELGVEKAQEAPESLKHLMGDLRLPKEVAMYVLSQVEDTKNGAMRVVARETRDFLEHTNLAHELQKVLTTLQFEINTTIRFRPNDQKNESTESDGDGEKLPKPEVKLDVFARRSAEKKGKKEG